MEKDTILEECLDYFTSTPVLKKVLNRCSEKYRSFGKTYGTVVLRGINADEIEILEGFTGKNYHGKKSISFSVAVIQKALDGSRFAGIRLEHLLALYHNGDLKSKKQEVQDNKIITAGFYERLAMAFGNSRAGEWLRQVMAEDTGFYRMLQKKYRDKVLNSKAKRGEKEDLLWKEMEIWITSLNHLPAFYNGYEYLPAFSAAVSGDPHYYDEGREYTLLFYHAINDILHLDKEVSSVMPAEDRHQLLFMAGLIRDDMSNDAMVYGIRAWREAGEHLGIAGFFRQKEPLSITLSTIIGLKCASCMDNHIYVVENPVVFAKIIESENKSALCVNGQPNLAVLLLLDLLIQNGGVIYYNGDFDPEGLLIAQRLKNRYGEAFRFWHYEDEDFRKALSENPVSEKRLRMLAGLSAPELIRIADKIKIHKKAGYQERIYFM